MNQAKIHITTTDFLVTSETFDLVYDPYFDVLVTSPQPKPSELSKYYESDDYISHTDENKGVLSFLYQRVKKYSLKKKLSLIKKQNNGVGSLLDIGTGTADFLVEAKRSGWNVQGVEPNEMATSLALKKGITLEPEIDAYHGKQFDVVTLWHVLEHLPDLEKVTRQIESLVKPGGTLVIAVPNYKSYDANFYKEYWAAYDVPRHLWHFSQGSMKTLFSETTKLIATKPMYFDSFYVSLLSEKYKNGYKFSLKALCIGFWSNFRALWSKEYSSLIYCFKRD